MYIFRKKSRREHEPQIAAEQTSAPDYTGLPDDVAALFESVSASDETVMARQLPYAAAVAANNHAQEEARKKAEAKVFRTAKPGQTMPDGTIFLGKYTLKDGGDDSLSQTFNVFAAPEDLPETMRYIDAVEHISKLKGWHGHDGTHYANDTEINKALKDGSYDGGWVIPPRKLLSGTEVDRVVACHEAPIVQPDNLFDRRNKGSFQNTFKMATDIDNGWEDTLCAYWSSTEVTRPYTYCFWVTNFSDGSEIWHNKDVDRLNCRPVRFELAGGT
jgi:hypothetical protein